MLEIDLDKIIPVTKVRANIRAVVDDVAKGNLYVLTKNGQPAVLLVPVSMSKAIFAESQAKNSNQILVEAKKPVKETTSTSENLGKTEQQKTDFEPQKEILPPKEEQEESASGEEATKINLEEVDKALEEYEKQNSNLSN